MPAAAALAVPAVLAAVPDSASMLPHLVLVLLLVVRLPHLLLVPISIIMIMVMITLSSS